MTRFSCIAKDGAQIDARACVERQLNERCHCPKAPFAINEYAPTVDPTSLKAKEDLDVLRIRACSYYRKAAAEQYAGPALEAQRAKEVPPCAEPIPATGDDATTKGTIPAAEPVATAPEVPSGTDVDKICKVFACGAPLRADNQSGMCGPHTMEARTISGAKRLGVPRLVYPSAYTGKPRHARREKGNVVSIKPEGALPKVEALRKYNTELKDSKFPEYPDPTVLPHAYLIACGEELRRRYEEIANSLSITVQAAGSAR